MTLVVRDEADVVGEQLAFHLNAGVDFVIATDHRSADGTTEILESYAHEGVLRLFREDVKFIRQGEWQTRMARLAATEYGADWVILSDADEFWWPRESSLKHALSAVPKGMSVVHVLTRNFIPPLDDTGWFAERMTVRLATAASINDPTGAYRPVVKVAHRGHSQVSVGRGGHQAYGLPGSSLRRSPPLEILHFPFRSRQQCAWKYRRTWTGWQKNLRGDLARARAVSEEGREDAIWDRVAVDEAALQRGLVDCSLVSDTRLHDALVSLRAGSGGFARAGLGGEGLRFRRPTSTEEAAHALDFALFEEAEVVRAQRRVDDIEARLARLERG